MVGLAVAEAHQVPEAGYLAPTCDASGDVHSTLFHPPGYSLWEVEAELPAGAELRWTAGHGDEVVFVLGGELEANGQRCGTKGSIIVEAGVATTVRAITDAKVIHFGPASSDPPSDGLFGAPKEADRGVHVIAADQTRTPGATATAHYYADSTCDTCRITFFEVNVPEPRAATSHTHSQDEIIRVLDGELRVGPVTVGTGMSVAIPGGHRYGFRTPGAFAFLNYRRDVSTYVTAPGTPPIVETVESMHSRSRDERSQSTSSQTA